MTTDEESKVVSNGEDLARADIEVEAIRDPENNDLEFLMASTEPVLSDQSGAGQARDPMEFGPADANRAPPEATIDLPPLAELEQSKEDSERERMKLLVSHFDEQQMARYAAFRRANIRRAAVKKYASQLLNQPISNSVAVVLAGMSKVLIGDIIELARDLQEKEQASERKQLGLPDPQPGTEPEPLLPSFIREAWRIYKEDTGTVPGPKLKPGSGSRFF